MHTGIFVMWRRQFRGDRPAEGRSTHLLLAVFLLVIFAISTAYAGALVESVVSSTGNGPTLQQAINSGLLTAIEEANGTTMASVSAFASLQASASTENSAVYLSSEGYEAAVVQATGGAVTGFKIVSDHRNPDGSWLVTLQVHVAKYQRSAAESRTTIVIAVPHGGAQRYEVFGMEAPAQRVAAQLTSEVQNYLVNTNKFTVLDRNHDAAVARELDIAEGSQSSTGQFAMLGQKLAAQYVLVTSIEHLNFVDVRTKSRTGNHVYSQRAGSMSVRFELIGTATQQVALSHTTELRYDHLGLSDSAAPDTVLADSIGQIARREGASVLHFLFPIRILAQDNSEYIIDAGEDVVSPGQIYKVMTYGAAITDPDTHESLGRVENYCCEIRITRVAAKFSYGTLVAPVKSLKDFAPDHYVLGEELTTRPGGRAHAGANAMKALEQEIKKQQQAASGTGNGSF